LQLNGDIRCRIVDFTLFHEGGPRAEGCFVSDPVNFLLITSIIVSCDRWVQIRGVVVSGWELLV